MGLGLGPTGQLQEFRNRTMIHVLPAWEWHGTVPLLQAIRSSRSCSAAGSRAMGDVKGLLCV